jgi:hypothetical protein
VTVSKAEGTTRLGPTSKQIEPDEKDATMHRYVPPLLSTSRVLGLGLALALAACGSGSETATGASTTPVTGTASTSGATGTPSTPDTAKSDAGGTSAPGVTPPSGASTTGSIVTPASDGSAPPPGNRAPGLRIGGGGAIGTIEITITRPDDAPISYTIGCLGDAFPVTPSVDGVEGSEACAKLADPAVLARLTGGESPAKACTQIYGGPDVATITGEIDGKLVKATIGRADGCGVNDWDNLLSGLLPPAVGVR